MAEDLGSPVSRTEHQYSRSPSRLDLPTVRALSANYVGGRPRPHVVLVTHVLPTAVAYVEALRTVFDVSVIAIPYSVNRLAAQRLAAEGTLVIIPKDLCDIPVDALRLVQRAVVSGQRVVVQEIGGYLADHAAEFGKVAGFQGVVEDTNNGHWRYESRAETLTYPVISIAHSPLKNLEDLQIGEAVCFSVERVLRHRLSRILRCAQVLVIGYGAIGSSCSAAFRSRGAATAVYDIDPLKLMRAHASGFQVGELPQLAARADIVIGATGQCSIGPDVAAVLPDGAVVASASSRQLEIDLAGLRERYRTRRIAAEIDLWQRAGQQFFVLGSGFPINFRDHSVVGPYLDAVYAELFVCIREVVEGRARPGLHSSWAKLHQEVANQWCRVHLQTDLGIDGQVLRPVLPWSGVPVG